MNLKDTYLHDGDLALVRALQLNSNKIQYQLANATHTWQDLVDLSSYGRTLVDNILEGDTSGSNMTYAPYSSTTSNLTWVNENANAGKLYLGDVDPVKTTRLNYNGYFYATNTLAYYDLSSINAKKITNNSDLNDFVTSGVYTQAGGHLGSAITGVTNKPNFQGGYKLIVETEGATTTAYVRLTIYTCNGLSFYRTKISSTENGVTTDSWTEWKTQLDSSNYSNYAVPTSWILTSTTSLSDSHEDNKIPTSLTVWNAITNAISANDAMVFAGTLKRDSNGKLVFVTHNNLDFGLTITDNTTRLDLITKYRAGWTFKIVEGNGLTDIDNTTPVEVGDIVMCIKDKSTNFSNSDFTIILTNIDPTLFATKLELENYVTLNTVQTITANKTFTSHVNIDSSNIGNLVAANAAINNKIYANGFAHTTAITTESHPENCILLADGNYISKASLLSEVDKSDCLLKPLTNKTVWGQTYLNTNGEFLDVTGDLTLSNSNSGDTPAIIFLRGALLSTNTAIDWKIYSGSGKLYVMSNNSTNTNGNSTSEFKNRLVITELGDVTASKFIKSNPTNTNGILLVNGNDIPQSTFLTSAALDDYLPLTGGTMKSDSNNNPPYIYFPASAPTIDNTKGFGISYGRILGLGNIIIAADTNRSGGEYVVITGGYEITNNISDSKQVGLSIGSTKSGTTYTPKLLWCNLNVLHEGYLGYSTNEKNYAVLKDSYGKLYVNVPWSDGTSPAYTKSETSYSLSKNEWTDGITLSGNDTFTDGSSYIINIKDKKTVNNTAKENYYTGVFVYTATGAKDEIPLHSGIVELGAKRIYAAIDAGKLTFSSLDDNSTAHLLTINITKLI